MLIRTIRLGGEIFALALVYFFTARVSLLLALPHGYAAPIWPVAGIALVAILFRGNRVASGIWLGSFLANASIAFDATSTALLLKSLLVPAGIGVGATLQAIAGAILIRRFVGFPTPLDRAQDVIRFLALGGPASCVISASVGVTVLLVAGKLPVDSYAFNWWAWWIGEAIGVLVATPLVLTWFGQPHDIWRRRRKTVALPICLAFAVILGVFAAGKEPIFTAPHTWVAWFVLAGGMAFTGLLGAFLLVISGNASLWDHDALTGLPNRILLQDRLHQAIAFARRNRRRVAILFIDLDHFKNINDSLGHHIGDKVLKLAAMRLQECVREGDSVARLGGDEFVVILPLLGSSSDAARVARKALDTLSQPCSVESNELQLGGSIGISIYPDDGHDVDALIRSADAAMYSAKQIGRGNFQFFTSALNQAAQQRREIDNRLRYAFAQDEFILHYQPQVEMESGVIFATEALLRWESPGSPPISCGEFIANAEESGLIVPIGEWALREACRQLKIWRDAGHPNLKMAVNLSPRQVEQADFCALVGYILDETGIPATALQLEITESILMQPSENNLSTLTRLSDMGIQLSVDDFGTGYSSLASLQRFPVHGLKIDQSFVHDIGEDPKDSALVSAIIAMAASLHLEVIAEGVETLQQAQFLMARGCHEAQGFYYGKPMSAQAFSDVIQINRFH